MAHSRASSLADDYYMQSQRSSVYSDQQAPSTTSSSLQQQPHHPQHQQQTVRKAASLAQIGVPSFSAFRSQASSIPVPRKPAAFLQSSLSPRPSSYSLAEQASPRLADPASRPLSLDSPLPQQPTGLASVLSPPLTEASSTRQEDRWVLRRVCGARGCSADTETGHHILRPAQHMTAMSP